MKNSAKSENEFLLSIPSYRNMMLVWILACVRYTECIDKIQKAAVYGFLADAVCQDEARPVCIGTV